MPVPHARHNVDRSAGGLVSRGGPGGPGVPEAMVRKIPARPDGVVDRGPGNKLTDLPSGPSARSRVHRKTPVQSGYRAPALRSPGVTDHHPVWEEFVRTCASAYNSCYSSHRQSPCDSSGGCRPGPTGPAHVDRPRRSSPCAVARPGGRSSLAPSRPCPSTVHVQIQEEVPNARAPGSLRPAPRSDLQSVQGRPPFRRRPARRMHQTTGTRIPKPTWSPTGIP
jgi:hypothetical protein